MMTSVRARFGILLSAVALMAGATPTAAAAQQPLVTPVSGLVEIRLPGADFAPVAESGSYPGDAVLRTGSDGFAVINYADSTEIVVRPGTEVALGGEGDEGVRVFLGKVLLRVRRLFTAGQERTYRTPTTVAAVRGTEFGLVVQADGTTRVFVFEGLVAVGNTELSAPPIEVGAGSVTEVAPQRPPTEPRAFQSGEFERGGAGEIERGEDRAVEAGQAPTTARFLAFSDHDLDALENPAYLAVGPDRGGTGMLFASAGSSEERVTVDGVTVFDEEGGGSRALAQAFAWVPLGGGVRLGAVAQGDLGDDQAVRVIRAPGSTEDVLTQDDSDWRLAEGRLLASVLRGSTSFGLSVGHRQGSRDAVASPAGSVTTAPTAEGESDITSFSVGLRRAGRRTVGLSYQHSRVDWRQVTGADVLTSEGTHDALETLVRSWDERGGWGGWLRLARTETLEDRMQSGARAYQEDLTVWTMRAGLGLGYMPTPDVLFSFDVAGGVADEAAIQTGPDGAQIEDETDVRLSGSLHVGAQVTLVGPWKAEVSVLHSVERIDRDYVFGAAAAPTARVTDVRSLFESRAVLGLMYSGRAWTARYAVSSSGEGNNRPWFHSVLVAFGSR